MHSPEHGLPLPPLGRLALVLAAALVLLVAAALHFERPPPGRQDLALLERGSPVESNSNVISCY